MARNPKDALVSFYHFHRIAGFLPNPSSFEDFVDEFLEGTGGSPGLKGGLTEPPPCHKAGGQLCIFVLAPLRSAPPGSQPRAAGTAAPPLFPPSSGFFGSWFDHVKGWLGLQKDLNLLFVTYEELHQVGTPSTYPTGHLSQVLLSQSPSVPSSSRTFCEACFPKTGLPTILVLSESLAAPGSDISCLQLS